MKYWFFDGSDVIGPLTLKELTEQKSFSETSLVCPENFSDDGDHWQVAATFAEFKPFFVPVAEDENTSTFEQELDTLLHERSPLAFDETPSEGPGLQIPKKPAKPGPIEEYFNRVKEEDLGDILGIPNPNDDSDMDLAHALEKQLQKTSSTRREQQESTVDEQTALELTRATQTHHVATATEVFGPQTILQKKPVAKPAPKETTLSMPTVEPVTLPVLEPDPAPQPAHTPEKQPLQAPVAAQTQQTPAPAPQPDPAPQQEPAATENFEEDKPVEIIPDPALLRREKVEVNSVRARLKQTQEMKDFLHETQNTHLKRQEYTQRRMMVLLLAVVVIVGAILWALQLHHHKKTPPAKPLALTTATPAEELLEDLPAPPAPAAVKSELSAPQKALAIVQNYPLSNHRGTIAAYLNRVYKQQLAQGYSAAWETEPLYKNTYIVKYRLTKTRKEPIIYIFQADVAQEKLTAALNNISLDLVGKI